MLQTAADGLLVFAFVMTVPTSCLDIATRRATRYEIRLASILLFQIGYLVGLMWLVSTFGWSPVWHALAQVRSVNPVGWVVNLLFVIGLASPLLSALCAVDTLRHPYLRRVAPGGHRVLIEARLRPIYWSHWLTPRDTESQARSLRGFLLLVPALDPKALFAQIPRQ